MWEVMDLPTVLAGLARPLDGLDQTFIDRRKQIIRHERSAGGSLAIFLLLGKRVAAGQQSGEGRWQGSNEQSTWGLQKLSQSRDFSLRDEKLS